MTKDGIAPVKSWLSTRSEALESSPAPRRPARASTSSKKMTVGAVCVERLMLNRIQFVFSKITRHATYPRRAPS